MSLEFADGATELDALRVILKECNIIEDSSRSNHVRILNDEAFFNVGFGIFLAWIFEKKERNKYCFFKLDGAHTLFLTRPSTLLLLNYQNMQYVDNFFKGVPTGLGRHSVCPLRHTLLYNMGRLTEVEMNVDFLKCPPENVESCDEHKKVLKQSIIDAIISDPRYGAFFGGYPCMIKVRPKVFRFLFVPPDDAELGELDAPQKTTVKKGGQTSREERLFNAFLVLYIASFGNWDAISCNTQLVKPFESKEIDGVLWNEDGQLLVVLETTREGNLGSSGNHLKQKIYNSVIMHLVDKPRYIYLYITFGNNEDLTANVGHVVLTKRIKERYNVPFEIIDLPNKYEGIKDDRAGFSPDTYRGAFDYYLKAIKETLIEHEFVS